jgi:hypothetical protein
MVPIANGLYNRIRENVGGSLTGRTNNTTTAVTADGTPKNGINLERPRPKILETLFGTFSQDSIGYDTQGDAEDLYLSSQDSDDNRINMSQKEEERYLREHEKEDDADAILSEDEPDATNYGNDTEDNSDESTDSGSGNKEPTHEDYEGNTPHPRLNTNVSDRNTEETGEDGTPVKHIQSIDPSSNGDGSYSVETIIQHAADESIANKTTVNTGIQNEEEVKFPPTPHNNRPTPPTCKQHDPTNIETKIVAKSGHGAYIEGQISRRLYQSQPGPLKPYQLNITAFGKNRLASSSQHYNTIVLKDIHLKHPEDGQLCCGR